MLRPSINQIATKNESYYSVVLAVAKRAREIADELYTNNETLEEKPVKTAVEEDDDTVKTTVNYYAWLKDTGKHGLQAETAEGSIKRSSIKTGLANDTITYPTVGSDIHLCNLAV